jgi:hypothetical protein
MWFQVLTLAAVTAIFARELTWLARWDELMSTMRTASMRARGGSAPNRARGLAVLDAAPELLLGGGGRPLDRTHCFGFVLPNNYRLSNLISAIISYLPTAGFIEGSDRRFST